MKTRLLSWAPCVLAMVASVVVMALAHEMWRAHFGVPFVYAGDSLPHGLALKQVIDNGWFWSDPRLGAPIGEHFQDWPLPDVLPLLVAKLLSLFTGNWAVAMNALYVLSFPLVTLSAWWVMRKIGVSRWVAAVLAVLYAVLPYHAARGEYHLFLSGYYSVPLGVWLALSVMRGESPFENKHKTPQTIALCAVIGLSGIYYAAFALLFVLIATLVHLLTSRRWKQVLDGIGVVVAIFMFVVVSVAPAVVYHVQHGPNTAAAQRDAAESDFYGLKLAQMVLPAEEHRIDALSKLRHDYITKFPIPSEGNSTPIGAVASVGLLYLIGLAIGSLFLARKPSNEKARELSVLAVSGFLVATIGGVSTFIALFVTADIRSWNRISVALAFFALAAVGLLLDRALAKWATTRRWITPVVLSVLLVGGTIDQTTRQWVFPYRETNHLFLSDQSFFGDIENRLPKNAAIFELPAVSFPEANKTNDLAGYDLLKPYLHTQNLRWSFGGIKGRFESVWQDRLNASDVSKLLPELVAVGYQGLYIDRSGYSDRGAKLEDDVRAVLGDDARLTNVDNNKVFYDLRAYADRLRATEKVFLESQREDLLYPVFFEGNDHFYGIERGDEGRWQWAIGDNAKASLDAAAGASKTPASKTPVSKITRISFDIQTATGRNATFNITWPDGSRQTLQTASTPLHVEKTMALKEGRYNVKFESNAERIPAANDSRDLHFRLINLDASPG